MNFSNGDVYIGKIINGNINGKGIYNFVEGIEYIGEFKNNMKNGMEYAHLKWEYIYRII